MCLTHRDRDHCHYSDVTMSAMASQITGILIVSSTVCSGADRRMHYFVTEMCTRAQFCYKAAHCGTGALWDLWDWYIAVTKFGRRIYTEPALERLIRFVTTGNHIFHTSSGFIVDFTSVTCRNLRGTEKTLMCAAFQFSKSAAGVQRKHVKYQLRGYRSFMGFEYHWWQGKLRFSYNIYKYCAI